MPGNDNLPVILESGSWERRRLAGKWFSLPQDAKPAGPRLSREEKVIFHGSTNTGIPSHTSFDRYSASQFASRKQPCDSVRPTCSGLGVP